MHPASLLPQIRNPKSLLALILAGVYFYTNVAAAHAAEKSFWEQRRAAVKKFAGSDARKVGPAAEAYQTLARLPAAPVALGLHASPSAPGAMPAPQSLSRERGSPLPADVRSLPTWLSQVVLPFGSVREIHLEKDPAAPLIVHIQDVHGHYEAQKNMARILQGLAEERGIGLIGLEGAEGGFVTAEIRASADKAALERASEDFLKRGLLGGPEHIALTAAKELTLWGSEDTPLYLDNIRAVKESLRLKPEARRTLEKRERLLAGLKDRVYSPKLKEHDRRAAAYREKQEDLGLYVGYLLSAPAGAASPPPSAYPNLRLLRDALRREKSLDFAAVEKERLALIEELAARADEAALNGLVQQSLLYRMGRMSYGDYYEFLKNLCARHKISLSAHPRLASYIDYVKAAEKIHRENLLKELDALEETLGDRLADGDAQKRLLALDRDHALLDRLLSLEMTPEAWAKYEARRADVLLIPSRLREWTAEPAAGPAEPAGEELLRPFEDFCRAAVRRNEALSRNILARMKAEKIPAAVLVAGGFHTEGLAGGFKRSGVSYAVVTPRVEGSLDASKNYLDVFARDPLPLEKLIAGEPISLLHPLALAATPPPGYADQGRDVQTALRRSAGAPGSAPAERFKTAAKFSAAAVTAKALAAQTGGQFVSFARAAAAHVRSLAQSHPGPTAGLVMAAAMILLYAGSQFFPAALMGYSFSSPPLLPPAGQPERRSRIYSFQREAWEEMTGDAQVPYGPKPIKNRVQNLLEILFKDRRPPVAILELGSSKYPVASSLLMKEGRVLLGIDVGLPMETMKGEGFASPGLLIRGDVHNLEEALRKPVVRDFLSAHTGAPSPQFDLVVMSDVLNYVDYRQVIAEALEYLSPSGRLMIVNMAGAGIPSLFSENGVKANSELFFFLQDGLGLAIEVRETAATDITVDRNSLSREIILARRKNATASNSAAPVALTAVSNEMARIADMSTDDLFAFLQSDAARAYHRAAMERFQPEEGGEAGYSRHIWSVARNNMPAAYFRVLRALLQHGRLSGGARILEIGPGPGSFVHLLTSLGLEAEGLEREEAFVRYGNDHGVKMVHGNILNPPAHTLDNPYDVTVGHLVLDALAPPGPEAFWASRLEEFQALIHISRLTKTDGVSIQEVDPSSDLPFSEEEFRMAGFEVAENPHGAFVVLRKIREPSSLEAFREYLKKRGDEPARPGNSRVGWWMSWQNGDVEGVVEFLQDRLAAGSPLTAERLRGWLKADPVLARQMNSGRWRPGESRAVQGDRARNSSGSWLWYKDWRYPTWSLRDYARERGWKEESVVSSAVGAVVSAVLLLFGQSPTASLYASAIATAGFFLAGHVADLFFPSHRQGWAGRVRAAAILVLAGALPLMLQMVAGMAHPAFASFPAASAAYGLSAALFLRGHYRVNHREDEPPGGERLKIFLRGHIRRDPRAAVVFGDLTRMRMFNNLYGRRTVDGLMQGVLAAVFKEFKKQNPFFRKHTAGRQGGDEFIGVLYPRNGGWPGAGLQAIKDAAASFDARTAARYGFGRFQARGLTDAQWERIQRKAARRLNRPRWGRGLAGIHNTRAGWTVVYNREGRDLSTAYRDAIRWLNAEAAKEGGSVEPLPDFTVPLRAPGVSLGAFVPDPAPAPGERDLDQELAAADQSRQESRLSRAEDRELESAAGARGKKHSMRPLTDREKELLAEKRRRLEILGEQAGLPAQALATSAPAFNRSYLGRYLSRRSGPTQVIKIQMQYRFPVDIRRELLQIFLTMTHLRGHGEYSGGKGVNEVLDHETMDMFIARTAMEIDGILLRRSREEDALFLGRPDEFFVVTGRPMSEDDLTGLADRIQVAAHRQFQDLFTEDARAETHVRVTMTVAESDFGPARPDREEIQDLLDRVARRSAIPAQHSRLHDIGRGIGLIQELVTQKTRTVIRFSHAEDKKVLEERIRLSSIALAEDALGEFRRLYPSDEPGAPANPSREPPARDDILEPWGLRGGLSPRFALGYDVLISLAEEGLFRYGALAMLPPLLVSGGLPILSAQAVGLLAAGPGFLFAHTISRWLAARRRGEDWRWSRELKKDFLSPIALRRLFYSLPFVIFPTLNIPIAAAFLVSAALHFRTERRASEPSARPLSRFGLLQRVSSLAESALSPWRRLAGSTGRAARVRPALALGAALAAFAALSILHGGGVGSGASFSMAVVLLAAPSPTKTDGAAARILNDAASRLRPFDWSDEEIESGLPRFPFETWIFREFPEDGRSLHVSVHDSPLIVPSTKVFALNLSVDPDDPRTVRLGPGALQERYNALYPHGHAERLSMTRWMAESFHPWMARAGFERITVTVFWGRSAEFFRGLGYENDPHSPNTMIKALTSDKAAAGVLLPKFLGKPRGTLSHFPEGQHRQGISDSARRRRSTTTRLLKGRPYGAGSEAKKQLRALLRDLDDRGEIGSLVLDLGSGETPVSQALAPKPGRAVLGVDAGLSRPVIYRNGSILPTLLIEGDIQDLDSTLGRLPVRRFLRLHAREEAARFDTIILSDILNFVDYRRVLQDVRSRLSPGGRLVIMNMAGTGVRPLLHEKGVKSNAALAAFLQGDLGMVVETRASPGTDRDNALHSPFRQILVARRETVDEALTRMSRLQDNIQKVALAGQILDQLKLSLRGETGDLHLKQLRLQSISLVRLLRATKSRETVPLLLDILRLPFRGRATGVAAESLQALSALYEGERSELEKRLTPLLNESLDPRAWHEIFLLLGKPSLGRMLEALLAPAQPTTPFGRELEELVMRLNPALQSALRLFAPKYPIACETACSAAQKILSEALRDRASVEVHGGRFAGQADDDRYAWMHAWLMITEHATGDRYYLSFVDGQFVPYSEEKLSPMGQADPAYRQWFQEQGLAVPNLKPLPAGDPEPFLRRMGMITLTDRALETLGENQPRVTGETRKIRKFLALAPQRPALGNQPRPQAQAAEARFQPAFADNILEPFGRPAWMPVGIYYPLVSLWEEGFFRYLALHLLPQWFGPWGWAAGLLISGPGFLLAHAIARRVKHRSGGPWDGWGRELKKDFISRRAVLRMLYTPAFLIPFSPPARLLAVTAAHTAADYFGERRLRASISPAQLSPGPSEKRAAHPDLSRRLKRVRAVIADFDNTLAPDYGSTEDHIDPNIRGGLTILLHGGLRVMVASGNDADMLNERYAAEFPGQILEGQFLAPEGAGRFLRADGRGRFTETLWSLPLGDENLLRELMEIAQNAIKETLPEHPELAETVTPGPESYGIWLRPSDNPVELTIFIPAKAFEAMGMSPGTARAEEARVKEAINTRIQSALQDPRFKGLRSFTTSVAVEVTRADKSDGVLNFMIHTSRFWRLAALLLGRPAAKWLLRRFGGRNVLILGDSANDVPMYRALGRAIKVHVGEQDLGLPQDVIHWQESHGPAAANRVLISLKEALGLTAPGARHRNDRGPPLYFSLQGATSPSKKDSPAIHGNGLVESAYDLAIVGVKSGILALRDDVISGGQDAPAAAAALGDLLEISKDPLEIGRPLTASEIRREAAEAMVEAIRALGNRTVPRSPDEILAMAASIRPLVAILTNQEFADALRGAAVSALNGAARAHRDISWLAVFALAQSPAWNNFAEEAARRISSAPGYFQPIPGAVYPAPAKNDLILWQGRLGVVLDVTKGANESPAAAVQVLRRVRVETLSPGDMVRIVPQKPSGGVEGWENVVIYPTGTIERLNAAGHAVWTSVPSPAGPLDVVRGRDDQGDFYSIYLNGDRIDKDGARWMEVRDDDGAAFTIRWVQLEPSRQGQGILSSLLSAYIIPNMRRRGIDRLGITETDNPDMIRAVTRFLDPGTIRLTWRNRKEAADRIIEVENPENFLALMSPLEVVRENGSNTTLRIVREGDKDAIRSTGEPVKAARTEDGLGLRVEDPETKERLSVRFADTVATIDGRLKQEPKAGDTRASGRGRGSSVSLSLPSNYLVIAAALWVQAHLKVLLHFPSFYAKAAAGRVAGGGMAAHPLPHRAKVAWPAAKMMAPLLPAVQGANLRAVPDTPRTADAWNKLWKNSKSRAREISEQPLYPVLRAPLIELPALPLAAMILNPLWGWPAVALFAFAFALWHETGAEPAPAWKRALRIAGRTLAAFGLSELALSAGPSAWEQLAAGLFGHGIYNALTRALGLDDLLLSASISAPDLEKLAEAVMSDLDGKPAAAWLGLLNGEQVWLGRDSSGWLRLKVGYRPYKLHAETGRIIPEGKVEIPAGLAAMRENGELFLKINGSRIKIDPSDPLKEQDGVRRLMFAVEPPARRADGDLDFAVHLRLNGTEVKRNAVAGRWSLEDDGSPKLTISQAYLDDGALPGDRNAELSRLGLFSTILAAVAGRGPPTIVQLRAVPETRAVDMFWETVGEFVRGLPRNPLGGAKPHDISWGELSERLGTEYQALERALEKKLPETPLGRALAQAGFRQLSFDWASLRSGDALHILARLPPPEAPANLPGADSAVPVPDAGPRRTGFGQSLTTTLLLALTAPFLALMSRFFSPGPQKPSPRPKMNTVYILALMKRLAQEDPHRWEGVPSRISDALHSPARGRVLGWASLPFSAVEEWIWHPLGALLAWVRLEGARVSPRESYVQSSFAADESDSWRTAVVAGAAPLAWFAAMFLNGFWSIGLDFGSLQGALTTFLDVGGTLMGVQHVARARDTDSDIHRVLYVVQERALRPLFPFLIPRLHLRASRSGALRSPAGDADSARSLAQAMDEDPHWTFEILGRVSGLSRSEVGRLLLSDPALALPLKRRLAGLISAHGQNAEAIGRALATNGFRIRNLLFKDPDLTARFNAAPLPRRARPGSRNDGTLRLLAYLKGDIDQPPIDRVRIKDDSYADKSYAVGGKMVRHSISRHPDLVGREMEREGVEFADGSRGARFWILTEAGERDFPHADFRLADENGRLLHNRAEGFQRFPLALPDFDPKLVPVSEDKQPLDRLRLARWLAVGGPAPEPSVFPLERRHGLHLYNLSGADVALPIPDPLFGGTARLVPLQWGEGTRGVIIETEDSEGTWNETARYALFKDGRFLRKPLSPLELAMEARYGSLAEAYRAYLEKPGSPQDFFHEALGPGHPAVTQAYIVRFAAVASHQPSSSQGTDRPGEKRAAPDPEKPVPAPQPPSSIQGSAARSPLPAGMAVGAAVEHQTADPAQSHGPGTILAVDPKSGRMTVRFPYREDKTLASDYLNRAEPGYVDALQTDPILRRAMVAGLEAVANLQRTSGEKTRARMTQIHLTAGHLLDVLNWNTRQGDIPALKKKLDQLHVAYTAQSQFASQLTRRQFVVSLDHLWRRYSREADGRTPTEWFDAAEPWTGWEKYERPIPAAGSQGGTPPGSDGPGAAWIHGRFAEPSGAVGWSLWSIIRQSILLPVYPLARLLLPAASAHPRPEARGRNSRAGRIIAIMALPLAPIFALARKVRMAGSAGQFSTPGPLPKHVPGERYRRERVKQTLRSVFLGGPARSVRVIPMEELAIAENGAYPSEKIRAKVQSLQGQFVAAEKTLTALGRTWEYRDMERDENYAGFSGELDGALRDLADGELAAKAARAAEEPEEAARALAALYGPRNTSLAAALGGDRRLAAGNRRRASERRREDMAMLSRLLSGNAGARETFAAAYNSFTKTLFRLRSASGRLETNMGKDAKTATLVEWSENLARGGKPSGPESTAAGRAAQAVHYLRVHPEANPVVTAVRGRAEESSLIARLAEKAGVEATEIQDLISQGKLFLHISGSARKRLSAAEILKTLQDSVAVSSLEIFALDTDHWDLSGVEDIAKMLVMLAGDLLYDASLRIREDLRRLTLLSEQA